MPFAFFGSGELSMHDAQLKDEPQAQDYTGDQPQGPGPDDDDRIKRPPRRRPRRPGSQPRSYFRWLLASAATTPRPR